MNETILTPRQKYILNLVNQSESLSREEIQNKLDLTYPTSKPTLIRELNFLHEKKLIKSKGQAKAIRYLPAAANPLLRVFEIDRYFADEPDARCGAKKSFDFQVFDHLKDLFSREELKLLKSSARDFSKETKKVNHGILKRELERFVIELSWKSSKIEGNTYSLLETETLIKEQKEAAGKTRDEAIMILNHKRAFEAILDAKADFKKISVSEINQLHNLLTKNLGVSSGIRKHAVGITGTTYQPLDNEHQLKEVFQKTADAINTAENPFEKALIVHFMIAYIQPYEDGNKRCARMMTNAILLAHNLFPLSYRSVNEDEFKKALILFYEQTSIFHVKRLFIEQFIFANKTYFR